jgi:hypothetical protein
MSIFWCWKLYKHSGDAGREDKLLMIRRNPGTFWTVFSLIIAFFLGVFLAVVDWMPEVESAIWQSWGLITVWYITYYNARWVNGLMRKHIERLKT